MTTMIISDGIPQPAQCYPFQPGEAVYYVNSGPYGVNHPNPPELVRAIVLEHQPAIFGRGGKRQKRVAILREDGRRSHVVGENLTYQGYCAFCAVPAVLGPGENTLECPKCSQPATALPPPEELTLRWYPLDTTITAIAVRACVLTGCSWSEGLDAWRKPHQRALGAMLAKHRLTYGRAMHEGPWNDYDFSDMMQWYAELGDDDSLLAFYKANGGKDYARAIDMMLDLFDHCLDAIENDEPPIRPTPPPLRIQRIADDSEPDGADATTRWLDGQFGRAA